MPLIKQGVQFTYGTGYRFALRSRPVRREQCDGS
jgi:hypothetical protein